jgi:hypothetical protein
MSRNSQTGNLVAVILVPAFLDEPYELAGATAYLLRSSCLTSLPFG